MLYETFPAKIAIGIAFTDETPYSISDREAVTVTLDILVNHLTILIPNFLLEFDFGIRLIRMLN